MGICIPCMPMDDVSGGCKQSCRARGEQRPGDSFDGLQIFVKEAGRYPGISRGKLLVFLAYSQRGPLEAPIAPFACS